MMFGYGFSVGFLNLFIAIIFSAPKYLVMLIYISLTPDKETAINAFRKASSSEQSIYEYASQYRAVASVEMRGVSLTPVTLTINTIFSVIIYTAV
jgi:hypothetical protein